jgi:adenylate cyclase
MTMSVHPPGRLAGIGEWLVQAAATGSSIAVLHERFCRELRDRGLNIWRSMMGLEVLHPEWSGSGHTWTAGEIETWQTARQGIALSPSYLNSPTRIVDETDAPFRRRLTEPVAELPVLEELRQQGGTDYVMFPLPFLDRSRTAVISFATQAAGGFADHDIAELETGANLIGPYLERQVLRRIAIDLLGVYVGADAGEKIFEGRIDRGDVETVHAAIWVCDLRGFTHLAEAAPREEVIATLNDWFDCMGDALAEHGGEILKFLGDGLLAIFPTVPTSKAEACDRAVDAARLALTNVDTANESRLKQGRAPIEFGLALHLGEVSYGNVGSRRRLDFTVIGPAVNHASRLQELTKTLGRPALASGALAACTTRPLTSLGLHRLRDVTEPVEVFAIPRASSSAAR